MNNPIYEKWVCVWHRKDKHLPMNGYYQGREKLTTYLDRISAIEKCISLNKTLNPKSEFKYSPQRFYDSDAERADKIKEAQKKARMTQSARNRFGF